MAAPERAFLDANVIRGQLTTDVLLSVAYAKAFRPQWSQEVLDEMRRNRASGVSEQQIDHRIEQMNSAFPKAMVTGYEDRIPRMQADENDKHVLAAAVHSNSRVLVTENTKDFHPPTSGPDQMRVERTSQFLSRLLNERRAQVLAGLRSMVARNRFEPRTMPELIDRMAAQQDLARFARQLNAVVPPEDRGTNPDLTEGQQRPATSIALDGVAPARRAAQGPGAAPQARTNKPEQGPERGPGRET